MNFFCDRCFPKRLTEALSIINGEDHSFLHHGDFFLQDAPDVEWLSVIGQWDSKPIVLSGDARILSRRNEVEALMQQNLFFVTMYNGWTSHDVYEQTWKLFKVWPLLLRELGKCKAPTVFKIVPAANNLENLGLTKRLRK